MRISDWSSDVCSSDLWVEPLGDWGEGEVHLVEIPTADEYHDNIVAFWRPKLPIAAGREHRWRYRLHWCRDHAWKPELATVAATRIGASNDGARLVVVDFAGGRLSKLAHDAKPQVDAAPPNGPLRHTGACRNARPGGRRSRFGIAVDTAVAAVDKRVELSV